MKRGRIVATIISALGAIGLALTVAFTASAGAATTAVAGKATAVAYTRARVPRYVALNCNFKPVVRPGRYVIACGDNGIGVEQLRWTSWTPQLATAYGTLWENDCRPNCARGHFRYYHALVMMWGSAAVKGHPYERHYTRITIVFPGARPPVYVLVKPHKLKATYPLTQTFGAI